MEITNISLWIVAFLPALFQAQVIYRTASRPPAYNPRPHYDGREITDEMRQRKRFEHLRKASRGPGMRVMADSSWIGPHNYDQPSYASESPFYTPAQEANRHYWMPPPSEPNYAYAPPPATQPAPPREPIRTYPGFSSFDTSEGRSNAIGQASGQSYQNIRDKADVRPIYGHYEAATGPFSSEQRPGMADYPRNAGYGENSWGQQQQQSDNRNSSIRDALRDSSRYRIE